MKRSILYISPFGLFTRAYLYKKNWPVAAFYVAAAFFMMQAVGAQAQSYYFRHYSIDDGLAQSQVLKIFEDDKKYLWLGTESGVSRFNGADFRNFNELNGLKGSIVSAISESSGAIVVKTESGISFIKNGVVVNTRTNGGHTDDILKDHDGNLWMIEDGRLNRIEREGIKPVTVTKAGNETVRTGTVDNSGILYIVVQGNGIYKMVNGRWINVLPFTGIYKDVRFEKLMVSSKAAIFYLLTYRQLYTAREGVIGKFDNSTINAAGNGLFSVAEDHGGALWVGSDHGAYYVKGDKTIHFDESNGFTNNMVNDIFIDSDDNTWLGVNGDGFYKFQGFDFLNFDKKAEPKLQLVMGFASDEKNSVWMATNGYGLMQFRGGKLRNVALPSGSPFSNYVNSLSSKNGQPILVGSSGGLWTLNDDKFSRPAEDTFLSKSINDAIYDNENTIWAALNRGCFYFKKNGEKGKVANFAGRVITLLAVGRDSIILGTERGIVLVKNGKVDSSFRCRMLENYPVDCLLKQQQFIFCGTSGGGLFVINTDGGYLMRFSTLNGLLSDDIYSLISDETRNIWIGTGKGIDKLKRSSSDKQYYLANDVLPNPVAEFNTGAIFDYQGRIWAGTTKGVFIFANPPDRHTRLRAPILNIESITLYDQDNGKENQTYTVVPPKIELGYGNTHVNITFRGIFYIQPETIKYQYRLKGIDQRFSVPTKTNQVEYSHLPPGSYTFQVQAITNNEVVSATKEISITVKPAFYQTSIFYVLLAGILAAVVILIQWSFHRRKNRRRLALAELKKNELVKIRKQTAEDFHDDIGNKLTRIVVLTDILEHKINSSGSDIKVIISQIKENAAALFSGAKDIIWALDPQSDDLNEILHYVQNFTIELFSNTDVDLVFEGFDKPLNRPLSLEYSRNLMMILKELLNNILKHAAPTQIILSVAAAAHEIQIVLKDNGCGFNVLSQSQGRGISNVKLRATRINGRVEIKSVRGKGTQTTITLLFGQS